MSERLRRLTLPQFRLLLPEPSVLSRVIDAVHVHHTWKPSRADFRGADTIEAMRRFHMAQGWSDIAQHLTVDPSGGLWTGRNWNVPPASSRGHNGTAKIGPFMIEIVGNFDKKHDAFDGAQQQAMIGVTAHVLRVYGLDENAIKFHRELNKGQKTCPGSGFDSDRFKKDVSAVLRAPAPTRAGVFPREFLLGASATRASSYLPAADELDATVPEHEVAARAIDQDTIASLARTQSRYASDLGRLIGSNESARGEDWTALKPHVINLTRGELSAGGQFTTTPADVDAIVDVIRDRATADPSLRILLYAHGGLVDEATALTYARTMYRWWMTKGVYPVFFVWESGLWEILRQQIPWRRDFADWTSDPAIEMLAKAPGTHIWSKMKESALRSSTADLGEGYPGGAYFFASRLAALLEGAFPDVTLHAIGHSAGAIFHAHLLPALAELSGRSVRTLSLFAPAARTDLFKEKLLPMINASRIERHTCFTMEEEAEEQDDCWKLYRKSLLYLVSHSFEGLKRRPILGLERSIRKDGELRSLYGIDEKGRHVGSGAARAEIQFSYTRDKPKNPLTHALAHGAFDNDPKTVSAALRRMLDLSDDTAFGEADFPSFPRAANSDVSATPVANWIAGATERAGGAPGRRLALCIGIDAYRDNPLAGCVNDARTWGSTLRTLDFDVRYLLDTEATGRRILDRLEEMVRDARPGDVLVMQYAGHGTQLPDDNGDEADKFDEAFVPVDYHTGALFLRDDVVATALTALPQGVLLTLFMDCCHCGTISRFAPQVRSVETTSDRVRYMQLPADLLAAARGARRSRLGARALPSSAPGVIHLAACRDNEFAWETNGHGDFTSAATNVLAESFKRGETNEAFMASVAKVVVKRGRQHPLMMPAAKGMADRPLLTPLASGERPSVAGHGGCGEEDVLAHLDAAVRLLRAGKGG